MKAAGTIPLYDPRPEVEELWDELNDAIQGVLRSGQFILGPNVAAFEEEVATYLGVKYAIGVNSGTDALVIGLRALGIRPGDEVITTPFTFFATAEAISNVGAEPVFVDVEPDTFNIDPDLIREAITDRTRAILPVHLFGHPCDMDPVLKIATEHGLKVLEDTAQAFGAASKGRKAGAMGDAGAFSFFPTKNLGGFGDGGMLTTNDAEVARVARMLRAHGSVDKYHNELLGYNSRLDEMQAAILRVKLHHLDENNDARRDAAERYRQAFAGFPGIVVPTEREGEHHVYHQYSLLVRDGRRDAVRAAAADAGVSTTVYYPTPVHKLPVYAHLGARAPQAERVATEILSLPLWPRIEPSVQERVVSAFR